MNVKGLKINKYMFKRLEEIGLDNIKSNLLTGMDEFHSFVWSSFNRPEFKDLIHCLNILNDEGVFDNIDDNQLFIFNYITDVTEMDIVTSLKDEDDQNVIIDIEYKTSVESKEKLDKQIKTRVEEHMSQLFLNQKYLIIAMDEDGFYKANYYDSNQNVEIIDVEVIKELISSFNQSDRVEAIFTQANNLAGIHLLYDDMEKGKFKYYEENKRATDYILEKINIGYKAILCLSGPGTGKTVVAYKLLFENPDAIMLMMNKKFYFSLGLQKYFRDGKCYFGTDTLRQHDYSDKILIIDECQRLSKNELLDIINKSKAAVIFGDLNQSFMPNDLNMDENELIEYLKENNVYSCKKQLKRSKRYNDSVDKALSYLSSKDNSLGKNIKLEDYEINLYNDEMQFLKKYQETISGKKMFTTYNNRSKNEIVIANEKFTMADSEFHTFAIVNGFDKYIGHSLHAISFDVENNFVYLDNIGIVSRRNKDVLYRKDYPMVIESVINQTLNELNVLFTRGKKSLNIYVDDLEAYLYLNRKIKQIVKS